MILEIKNLNKSFADHHVLQDVSFTITSGKAMGFLGRNGAGKTTTIKMLCGLLSPTSGDAVLLGDSIVEHPTAVKQKINLSPQETAVAPKLSVQENLELIARIYGSNKSEARSKTDAIMQAFGLSDRSKDKAKTLSGGLQRRLSIAMALISCLLYTSPSPRDRTRSRMPSSA